VADESVHHKSAEGLAALAPDTFQAGANLSRGITHELHLRVA
jgi:hypothetical protein